MAGTCHTSTGFSVHSSDKRVDQDLPVAMVPSLNEMPRLLPEPTTGTAQLKRPQEVVCFFEMRAHCVDLVDKVLHTDDAMFPKSLHKTTQ